MLRLARSRGLPCRVSLSPSPSSALGWQPVERTALVFKGFLSGTRLMVAGCGTILDGPFGPKLVIRVHAGRGAGRRARPRGFWNSGCR